MPLCQNASLPFSCSRQELKAQHGIARRFPSQFRQRTPARTLNLFWSQEMYEIADLETKSPSFLTWGTIRRCLLLVGVPILCR